MSKENPPVEIIRAGFDAWNRGDIDAMVQTWDPEIVFRTDPRWPDAQVLHGANEVRKLFESYREALQVQTEIEQLIEAGDRLIIRFRDRVHGSHSGFEDSWTYTQVVTYRDGKSILAEVFIDHGEALKAAGLSE
jgi:ketosteroid isomerase-like protein